MLDAADAGTADKLKAFEGEQAAGEKINDVVEKYYRINPRPVTGSWPYTSDLVVGEDASLGVSLSDTPDGGVEVRGVDAGSTAEEQRVHVGARIYAVNGEMMHGNDKKAVIARIKAMPKPWRVSMMLAQDMKMRDFMETMKRLFDNPPSKFPDVIKATAKMHLGIDVDT
jgi:C-terminal processing protease CtpA/Prc